MQDERYQVLLTLLAVIAVVWYPADAIGGLLYFCALSLFYLQRREIRSFCVRRLVPLLPAVALFAFTPLVLSLLRGSVHPLRTELSYGISVCLKTGVILIAMSTLVVTMSFSHFLRVLDTLHVPLRILFILMIAHRFFSVFVRDVRHLVAARTLRLFNRSQLTGIQPAVAVLIKKAMGYTETLYIAMRLRGGNSRMALLVELHHGKHDRTVFFAGLFGLIVPYIGYFILG